MSHQESHSEPLSSYSLSELREIVRSRTAASLETILVCEKFNTRISRRKSRHWTLGGPGGQARTDLAQASAHRDAAKADAMATEEQMRVLQGSLDVFKSRGVPRTLPNSSSSSSFGKRDRDRDRERDRERERDAGFFSSSFCQSHARASPHYVLWLRFLGWH